ncbi:MAG: hypothetical protein B6U94_06460 [Thermofilum sp. ex4484_79]|nr:MAG: hypothetical protein B6U94_06460 [Thermofilum sp. ex4484_79]
MQRGEGVFEIAPMPSAILVISKTTNKRKVVRRIVSAVDPEKMLLIQKRSYFLALMPMERQRKGAIWICWLS